MRRLSGVPFEPWLLQRIQAARHIVLSTHVGPDADGLGSQLAFVRAARASGREAVVVNEDPLPKRYAWLDPDGDIGHFERDSAKLQDADFALLFDTHEVDRAGRPAQKLREMGRDVWVIDHHAVRPDLELQGCVATEFSSSGELVYQLLRALQWPIDAIAARALYAAMSFDTGSFRFLRNQSQTLRVAADLLDTGFDANPVQEALFASRTRDETVLLGRCLTQIQFAGEGRIAWAAFDHTITAGLNVDDGAIGETIPDFVGIEGVLIAMQIKPGRKADEWKLSLRSKAAVKIGHVAQYFGGGGHEHAAGATLQGDKDALAAQVLLMLEEALLTAAG
jgi:phosphoesterase RecJ-like protein